MKLKCFALVPVSLCASLVASAAGVLNPPADLGQVREIATNKIGHFCAIDIESQLRCWGTQTRPLPVGLGHVRAMSMEFDTYCAVLETSGLQCWKILENGSLVDLSIPKQVVKVRSVSVGDDLICAQSREGLGFCWSPSSWWQGQGPLVELPGFFDDAFKLAVYGEGVCALLENGKMACLNVWRESGGAAPNQFLYPPRGVFSDASIVEGAGLAMTRDGYVLGLGWEYDHGAGMIPADLGRVIGISTAMLNGCAIQYDGAPSGFLKCWDLFDPAQGYYSGNATPITDRVLAVAVSYKAGCAILRDHTVKCWSEVAGLQ